MRLSNRTLAARIGVAPSTAHKIRHALGDKLAGRLAKIAGPAAGASIGVDGLDVEALAARVATILVGGPGRTGDDGRPEAVPPWATVHRAPDDLCPSPKPYRRVACLYDLHVPYHDERAIGAALECVRDWRPDLIVLGGDLFDCYGASRYAKDPGKVEYLQAEFDAGAETVRAIDSLGADVVYILGNHEARLDALMGENRSLYKLRALDLRRAANLPDRWTILPRGSKFRLGGLDYLHGDLKGRGQGAALVARWVFQKLKRSCLFGHFHKVQAHIEPDGDGTPRGGFSIGHLMDTDKGADYIDAPDWCQGFALVEHDHSNRLFDVHPKVIVDGRFIHAGKTYRG